MTPGLQEPGPRSLPARRAAALPRSRLRPPGRPPAYELRILTIQTRPHDTEPASPATAAGPAPPENPPAKHGGAFRASPSRGTRSRARRDQDPSPPPWRDEGVPDRKGEPGERPGGS